MTCIGLLGLNSGAAATPEAAARLAARADELGYDSLWMAQHAVLPQAPAAALPLSCRVSTLDPLVALGLMAGCTSRVRLAAGVVLPQRDPVLLADQLATLDVLSGGRLILGMDVGQLDAEPEPDPDDVPEAGRAGRAVEHLAAMRVRWQDAKPKLFRDVAFDAVDTRPRPLQRPLPVVMGGHGPAAHRRVVEHADGWYGFMLDREDAAAQISSLRAVADAAGRPFEQLSIAVSPSERLDAEVVADYEALGVHRLVVVPRLDWPLAKLEAFVEANAPTAVGAQFAPGYRSLAPASRRGRSRIPSKVSAPAARSARAVASSVA